MGDFFILKYRPGRRKRREIMKDLAVGEAFGLAPKDRQRLLPYQRRMALEALIEVDAAFNGEANRERCDIAVSMFIDKQRNTAREEISRLEAAGRVTFERKAVGSCVCIPAETHAAFRRIEYLEDKIDLVARVEDKGLSIDVTKEVQELKDAGVYCGATDEALDAGMEKIITEALEDKKAWIKAKSAFEDKKIIGNSKMTPLKNILPALAFVVLGLLAFPESTMADRAGTVGLGAEATLVLTSFER